MPFQSDKQRKYLYSQKPDVAEKFAKHNLGINFVKGLWDRFTKEEAKQLAGKTGKSVGKSQALEQTGSWLFGIPGLSWYLNPWTAGLYTAFKPGEIGDGTLPQSYRDKDFSFEDRRAGDYNMGTKKVHKYTLGTEWAGYYDEDFDTDIWSTGGGNTDNTNIGNTNNTGGVDLFSNDSYQGTPVGTIVYAGQRVPVIDKGDGNLYAAGNVIPKDQYGNIIKGEGGLAAAESTHNPNAPSQPLLASTPQSQGAVSSDIFSNIANQQQVNQGTKQQSKPVIGTPVHHLPDEAFSTLPDGTRVVTIDNQQYLYDETTGAVTQQYVPQPGPGEGSLDAAESTFIPPVSTTPSSITENIEDSTGGQLDKIQGASDKKKQEEIMANMIGRVQNALSAGYSPNDVAAKLRQQAQVTEEDTARAAMLSLGANLVAGSFNEMAKNIGQAGLNNQAYSPQLTFGEHLDKSLNTALEGKSKAQEIERKALEVDEAQKATELQKFGFIQSNLDNIVLKDDQGNDISLDVIKKTEPEMYQELARMLSQGSPEDIQRLVSEAGISGLPGPIFGIEATAGELSPYAKGVQSELGKSEGKFQAALAGLPQPLLNKILQEGVTSYALLDQRIRNGQVPNIKFGQHNGLDDRAFIFNKTGGEGLPRFSPFIEGIFKSDLLKESVEKSGAGNNWWKLVQSKILWNDDQSINTMNELISSVQARVLTGLQGDAAARAELAKIKSMKFGNNDDLNAKIFADNIQLMADVAYKYGGADIPVDVLLINKMGAKKWMEKVAGTGGNENDYVQKDGKIYYFPEDADKPILIQ